MALAEHDNLVVISGHAQIPAITGENWVVGGIVFDRQDRVFVQRRAYDRKLFPGCWDIVGGHVEPGEDVVGALAREVREETGWELAGVLASLGSYRWFAGQSERREVDYIVEVRGDLTRPAIEISKHPEFAWLTADDTAVLLENRDPGDRFIHDLIQKAFAVLASLT